MGGAVVRDGPGDQRTDSRGERGARVERRSSRCRSSRSRWDGPSVGRGPDGGAVQCGASQLSAWLHYSAWNGFSFGRVEATVAAVCGTAATPQRLSAWVKPPPLDAGTLTGVVAYSSPWQYADCVPVAGAWVYCETRIPAGEFAINVGYDYRAQCSGNPCAYAGGDFLVADIQCRDDDGGQLPCTN